MATITKTISKKIKPFTYEGEDGKFKTIMASEVMLRLRHKGRFDVKAGSGIFIDPCNFNEKTGKVAVNRRKVGNDIIYHEKAEARLAVLENRILGKANAGEVVTKEWLLRLVDEFHHPEKYDRKHTPSQELGEAYLKASAHKYPQGYRVLFHAVARYEAFRRYVEAQDKKHKGEPFTFAVDTITPEDIEDFRDYLRNEHELAEEYPKLFEKLTGGTPIMDRGENTIIKTMERLKAFFHWLRSTGRTDNDPFKGVTIGEEKYGTPYYLTIEERNAIASATMPTERLATQRDIFIFQCHVGCRVSDLLRLTESNIVDGVLSYVPRKTKDEAETPTTARVPLSDTAIGLVEKYRGKDRRGRLFPFISAQKYNEAIKEVLTFAGITREVEVRDTKTGEFELRPINELASSHLARRTFVGNAYAKVSDPNIIGKMSGHVEGSKAFSRYRNIEDELLRNVINLIG